MLPRRGGIPDCLLSDEVEVRIKMESMANSFFYLSSSVSVVVVELAVVATGSVARVGVGKK